MKDPFQSVFDPRQYMVSNDFEIFYYSDLQFHSVQPHTHAFYEFYFFVEGDVEMELGDGVFPLKRGDVILVPPGLTHRAVIRDGSVQYRRFVLWIGESFFEALPGACRYVRGRPGHEENPVMSFSAAEFNTLENRLFTMLDELHTARYGREEKLKLSLSDLLLQLSRLLYERDHGSPSEDKVSTYEALTSYIDRNIKTDLSLDLLSGRFYLSKYYISHLFKDTTGLSVHQYILKKRLEMAAIALREGMKNQEVCLSCGFGDYSSFFRAFKKEYGVSPETYKNSLKIS